MWFIHQPLAVRPHPSAGQGNLRSGPYQTRLISDWRDLAESHLWHHCQLSPMQVLYRGKISLRHRFPPAEAHIMSSAFVKWRWATLHGNIGNMEIYPVEHRRGSPLARDCHAGDNGFIRSHLCSAWVRLYPNASPTIS